LCACCKRSVRSLSAPARSRVQCFLMVRKETVLDSWKTVRQDTAQAVEDFPAAELDFKPVADLMSFREIARHILDAGHALTGLMLDGVEDMATPQFRESLSKYIAELPPTPDAAALAQALRDNV
jgi:hypothetical protein